MLSRSVLAEPAPSAPLAGTSRLHRRAAYPRCLRCAGAPRRPARGSGLSLPFRPDMPSSLTPGSSTSHVSSVAMPTRPSPRSERLGTPNTPAIRFTRDPLFEASLVRICYGLSGCSPPWTDRTKFPWPTGDFYIQASGGSVALPVAGYDYNSNWTPLLAGLSPAGMAASLAAPDRCGSPLFRALDALTVDDRGGRAGLSLGQLPTPDVKRVMDTIQRAVGVPAAEVVVHRAAGRQVLRQRCPLAAGAQDIHKPVDNLPLDNSTLIATPLGGRNQRCNDRPLGIRQVAGVTQLAPVIPGAVLVRPHRAAPANRTATMES